MVSGSIFWKLGGDVALIGGGAAQARGECLRHQGLEAVVGLFLQLAHRVEDVLFLRERLVRVFATAATDAAFDVIQRLGRRGHRVRGEFVHLFGVIRPGS